MTMPLSTNTIKYIQPILYQDTTGKKKGQKSNQKQEQGFDYLSDKIGWDTSELMEILDQKLKNISKLRAKFKKIQKMKSAITNINIEKKEKMLRNKLAKLREECGELESMLSMLGIDYNNSKLYLNKIKKALRKLDGINNSASRINTYRKCIEYLSKLDGKFFDDGMDIVLKTQNEENAKLKEEFAFWQSVGHGSFGVEETIHREQALKALGAHCAQIEVEERLIHDVYSHFRDPFSMFY